MFGLFAPPEVSVDFLNRQGLVIEMAGVPIVTGSMIQVYEPGWKKGLYSTNWNDVTVVNGKDGKQVTLKGQHLAGTIVASHLGDTLTVRYQLTWSGSSEVHTELSFGHLWAPAFENGSLKGAAKMNMNLGPGSPMTARHLMPPTRHFEFVTPAGDVTIDVDRPAKLFDARGYSVEIAPKNNLYWLGVSDQPLRPGVPTEFVVTWKFSPRVRNAGATVVSEATLAELPRAYDPAGLPTLKLLGGVSQSGTAVPWSIGSPLEWPKDQPNTLDLFRRVLKGWFAGISNSAMPVRGRISPSNLGPGGFEVKVEKGAINLLGHDAEGLRNAAMYAASATQSRNGKWVYTGGNVRQSPAVDWRGVHLFVGPEAEEFHKVLIERYFAPMRINRVVLQCERVAWDATPGTSTVQTMSKASLKRLVKAYREAGIEPIPLIQSWGHMEWLFANGKNLELAANRAVPYGIDPENPAARVMLEKIWREAFEIFDSKVIHVGLDEVDMRGWEKEDPAKLTRQWKLHLAWLGEFARANGKTLMLWGDHLLAPGQAPDAMNGNTAIDAKARRDALPRETYIADWHYINNANPAIYTSLELFKSEGLKPIASPWHRPENIRGFTAAANKAGVGVLQTTWAGYTSNLPNMSRAPDQFTQYLQMAHYAWTGGHTSPFSVHSAATNLAEFMSARPRPAKPRQGHSVGKGSHSQVGPTNFAMWKDSLPFFSRLEAANLPAKRAFRLAKPVNGEITIAMSVKIDRPYTAVARVTFLAKGREVGRQDLFSTWDLRKEDSPLGRLSKNGVAAIELTQKVPFDTLEVESLDALSGLTLHGITIH